MTSLRNFQHEIDEIHAREMGKQRVQVFERDKESKNLVTLASPSDAAKKGQVAFGIEDNDDDALLVRF